MSVKHRFSVAIARECGVNAAILFESIAFWTAHNAAKGQNEKDGAFWMFATQTEIASWFEYLTIKQTRTAIEKLTEAGFIQKGRFNKKGYDRTGWYALTEKGESVRREWQKEEAKRAKAKGKKGAPIQHNKTKLLKESEQEYNVSPFDF